MSLSSCALELERVLLLLLFGDALLALLPGPQENGPGGMLVVQAGGDDDAELESCTPNEPRNHENELVSGERELFAVEDGGVCCEFVSLELDDGGAWWALLLLSL